MMNIFDSQARNEYEKFLLLTLLPEFNEDINKEKQYVDELRNDINLKSGVKFGNEKATQKLINDYLKKKKDFAEKYGINTPLLKVYKKYRIINKHLFNLFVVFYCKNKSLPLLKDLQRMCPEELKSYELFVDEHTLAITIKTSLLIASSDWLEIKYLINDLKKRFGMKKNIVSHDNLIRDILAYKLSNHENKKYGEIQQILKTPFYYESPESVRKGIERVEKMITHLNQSFLIQPDQVRKQMFDKKGHDLNKPRPYSK